MFPFEKTLKIVGVSSKNRGHLMYSTNLKTKSKKEMKNSRITNVR